MINWALKKIIGSKNQREIKRLRPTVARINELEQQFQSLPEDDLRAKTAAWKDAWRRSRMPTSRGASSTRYCPKPSPW